MYLAETKFKIKKCNNSGIVITLLSSDTINLKLDLFLQLDCEQFQIHAIIMILFPTFLELYKISVKLLCSLSLRSFCLSLFIYSPVKMAINLLACRKCELRHYVLIFHNTVMIN